MLYWPEAPGPELIAQLQKADFSKLQDLFNSGVCVLKCPKTNEDVLCYPTAKMNANPAYYNCQYYPGNAVSTAVSSAVSSATGSAKVGAAAGAGLARVGPPFRYTTINVLDHFCLPDAADYIKPEYLETIKT